MRTNHFSRPTILAAVDLLKAHFSQAQFDQLALRLGLENEVVAETTPKKAVQLSKAVVQGGARVVATLDGSMTLPEAVIREAVRVTSAAGSSIEQGPFIRGLALDGFVVEWSRGTPSLRTALPADAIDLPAADDELHTLLREFGFTVPLGHLDQAIDAHTRGDWAAANSQCRTFLEGLLDAIAHHLEPARASALPTSENRRAMLATLQPRAFLSKDRNEWTDDGKNYINGLFKMLHTEGSHPGLSYDDHCTFRLHVVLITSRMLLRRLHYRQ